MIGGPADNTLYTDTDVNGRAIRAARQKTPGIKLVTAAEAGMLYADDLDHFTYAIQHGYVLVTANIQDFRPLYVDWLAGGREHPGIVFITPDESRHSSYLAEMLVLIAGIPMQNREEWI